MKEWLVTAKVTFLVILFIFMIVIATNVVGLRSDINELRLDIEDLDDEIFELEIDYLKEIRDKTGTLSVKTWFELYNLLSYENVIEELRTKLGKSVE